MVTSPNWRYWFTGLGRPIASRFLAFSPLATGRGEISIPDTAEAQQDAAATTSRNSGSSRPRGGITAGMLDLLWEKV